MKTISVPTLETAPAGSREMFVTIQKQLGFLPNLYATMGYSPQTLAAHLAFQAAQAEGPFTAREREAIALAVSEVNGCAYCLAGHTALAKLQQFSDAEILGLRQAESSETRLRVLTQLAADVTVKHGRPDADKVAAFFAENFDEEALIVLIALVADKTLANYIHNLTQIPVDFPAAPTLVKGGV